MKSMVCAQSRAGMNPWRVGAVVRTLPIFGAVLLGWGCSSDSESDDSGGLPSQTSETIATYAKIVHANYADTLTRVNELDAAISDFVDDPSESGLAEARQRWLDAREPYLQTEVFRFYEGPIDGPEGMINAWPLDEAYIDYTVDDPESGIINDPSVEISAESLMELNEQGGEENIATGFHAIEFLLWGQDRSDDGPGDRPYTDYVEGSDAPHAERRALYLQTVSTLLVEHIEGLVDAWQEGEDNYRAEFESAPAKDALGRILTGMINLSGFETGGERLQAALDSGSQEDEHSCFSDNTHRDMIQDIQGIKNVWLGRYERLDGTKVKGASVRDVVEAVDAELAEEINTQINESFELANALHVPFDREIAPDNDAGNQRVSALVSALHEVDHSLEGAYEELGLVVQGAK